MIPYKFKIGDIVRHSATTKSTGIRMIVIAAGYLKDETGEVNTYLLSGERNLFQKSETGPHFRTTLQENEMTLVDEIIAKDSLPSSKRTLNVPVMYFSSTLSRFFCAYRGYFNRIKLPF